MPEVKDSIKLTQYSHGAGCGCKISPMVLDKILKSNFAIKASRAVFAGPALTRLEELDAGVFPFQGIQ